MRSLYLMRLPSSSLLLVALVAAVLAGSDVGRSGRASAAHNLCHNYNSEVTPPESIRVGFTDPNNRLLVTHVIPVNFKSYVKDVLPNEWGEASWGMAAYQAGALAVKTFGWYFVNHWEEKNALDGQCYNVTDFEAHQVYCAGSGTPGSGASCPGTFVRDPSHATATSYATEQTWNWLLHSGGAIYPTFYNSGNSSHLCGQDSPPANLAPYPGSNMSQWGSQACALAQKTWAQIGNAYYRPNSYPNVNLTGDHIYGQGHAAMGWGPQPWWPVSTSSDLATGWVLWKFRNGNSCGSPSNTFTYDAAGSMRVVGDWDGNGTHTQGVAGLSGGLVYWNLRNSRDSGGANYSFAYGSYGDIPVIGDWDGDGDWTVGVYRGNTWLLNNYNAPGPPSITASWGSGGDIPMPGRWLQTSSPQPITLGVVRLDPTPTTGELKWLQRFANAPGGVDREFNWGPWWGRPITGDWWTGDGLTQFGPGIVTDDPPNPCASPPPNQLWTLKYTPSAGGIDLQFRYEFVRP